jgi:hypothetical protein
MQELHNCSVMKYGLILSNVWNLLEGISLLLYTLII